MCVCGQATCGIERWAITAEYLPLKLFARSKTPQESAADDHTISIQEGVWRELRVVCLAVIDLQAKLSCFAQIPDEIAEVCLVAKDLCWGQIGILWIIDCVANVHVK